MRVSGSSNTTMGLTGQCHPCPRLPVNTQHLLEREREREKQGESHTFILSESLVLVHDGCTLALCGHRTRRGVDESGYRDISNTNLS